MKQLQVLMMCLLISSPALAKDTRTCWADLVGSWDLVNRGDDVHEFTYKVSDTTPSECQSILEEIQTKRFVQIKDTIGRFGQRRSITRTFSVEDIEDSDWGLFWERY